MTGYTSRKIGGQWYVLITVVGSGRVKVAFDGGPDVGMWDASAPDPWVLKYEGFEAFRRTGDMTAADIELRALDRERRHPAQTVVASPEFCGGDRMRGTKARGQKQTVVDPCEGRHLVFRAPPHDTYLVFTTLERAERIDGYRKALKSKTWGEFRQKIGAQIYHKLFRDQFDEDNPEPEDHEGFNAEAVPGFSGGDFPPWLALEIERHVPEEILREFGTLKSTWVNGMYWHLDTARRDELLQALNAAGIKATERKDLAFW